MKVNYLKIFDKVMRSIDNAEENGQEIESIELSTVDYFDLKADPRTNNHASYPPRPGFMTFCNIKVIRIMAEALTEEEEEEEACVDCPDRYTRAGDCVKCMLGRDPFDIGQNPVAKGMTEEEKVEACRDCGDFDNRDTDCFGCYLRPNPLNICPDPDGPLIIPLDPKSPPAGYKSWFSQAEDGLNKLAKFKFKRPELDEKTAEILKKAGRIMDDQEPPSDWPSQLIGWDWGQKYLKSVELAAAEEKAAREAVDEADKIRDEQLAIEKAKYFNFMP